MNVQQLKDYYQAQVDFLNASIKNFEEMGPYAPSNFTTAMHLRKSRDMQHDFIKELNKIEIDQTTSDGYHTFEELYEYRILYNAALFNQWGIAGKHDVHKSFRHNDNEEPFGGGWFIVMAQLPTGQISNHYPIKDWDLFDIPSKDVANQWDGHTTAEATQRLRNFLINPKSRNKE